MSEEPVVIPDLSEWPVFHHKREWFITFIDRRKYFGGTIFGTTQLKKIKSHKIWNEFGPVSFQIDRDGCS